MATRVVRLNGDPILRKKSKPIKKMDERTITLIEDMFNTMHEKGGVGLAAPQVGVLKRICVVDCGIEKSEPYAFLNPQIIKKEGEQNGEEGCLSVPGYKGTVTRAQKILVRFLNINLEEMELEAEGLLSRCIQHEMDHLDGILYIDKVEGELKEVDASNEDAKKKSPAAQNVEKKSEKQENTKKNSSKFKSNDDHARDNGDINFSARDESDVSDKNENNRNFSRDKSSVISNNTGSWTNKVKAHS